MSNPIIPHDEPADKAAPVVAGNRMTRPDAVAEIEPCDRFGGGRETVTFERVDKEEEVK